MANREFENKMIEEGYKVIAGTDEAGRGPLAGPLVVAAVVLPNDYNNDLINDSKKLTPKKREALYDEIINHAISYSIQIISPQKVDELNVYRASQQGMTDCILNLASGCDCVLSDCMPLPKLKQKVVDIVKGDAKSISIAAASILAKVTRDRIMDELDEKYPQYGFKDNKGYGTKAHMEALEKYGFSDIHRKTYEPIKSMISSQLQFDLFDETK